jgi:hypothetical protein
VKGYRLDDVDGVDGMLAEIDEELDAIAAKLHTPERRELFRRIVLANFGDRGPEGWTEEEMIEACEADGYWDGEAQGLIREQVEYATMRELLIGHRDRLTGDDDES